MLNWKSMSVKDFKTFFSDFTIAVNKGEYRKMDYNTWKKIKNCAYDPEGKGRMVNFNYHTSLGVGVEFPYQGKSYRFTETDESFGQYIYEKLFKYEEDIPSDIKIDSSSIEINSDDSVSKVLSIPNTIDVANNYAANVSVHKSDVAEAWRVYNGTKAIIKISPTLAKYGVAEKDNEGNYRELCDIVEELAEKWDKEEGKSCLTIEGKKENKTKNKKEKKSMKFNFDFGPVKSDNVRMSVYGMAVRNSDGTFVSYDKVNGSVIDVDVFNFDGSKFMYKMPVALKDVTIGDVVIHNHVPMFVIDVNGASLEVVDIYHGENKSIIPTTNMFGFNFVTKVVSLIDMGTPNKDNPFGNMLPFLMMGDEDADMKDMAMAMMFMNGSGNGNANMMQNPLMMMMLMDKDNKSDMLPMLMLMNSMNQPQTCQCGDNCDHQ